MLVIYLPSPNPPQVQRDFLHKDQIFLFMHQFIENIVYVVGQTRSDFCWNLSNTEG